MKKSILNLGKQLNKNQQQFIKGGDNCYYYANQNFCFADNDPLCIPCNQLHNYPGAETCPQIDFGCFYD
ncbi:hypothetical protein [uncultured Tenacibaculum sp.]|uniref:hypothetical protein n=1 Tax=uncultured Tenacibaculum sp. TaxID=174713 RepID=UPI0026126739|nr:hypothetical protein [uncultured Tenacibaculum sp.]